MFLKCCRITPTVEKVTTEVRPGKESQVALSLLQPVGQAAALSAQQGAAA